MRLDEVQRRVREVREQAGGHWASASVRWWYVNYTKAIIYRDTLRTLLDHDISDDARQLIEAALEAER